MPESGFHFAHPWLLVFLLAPPAIWLWLRLTAPRKHTERYRLYADPRLLPFLLDYHDMPQRQQWRHFLGWSLLWSLLVIAIAGPRWDFHDVQLFRPGNDLVILLDLSRSMDVTDVSPSRLARARQEIQDLIEHNNHNTRIGLIGFATLAHVIAPLTEDGGSLRLLLPTLSTDLVELKGSRLTEALNRAEQMLAGQPADSSRHLLLITDGEFGDGDLEEYVKRLTRVGVHLHILGVGTPEGGLIMGPGGALHQADGTTVVARLDEDGLKKLAAAGNGIYQRADYRDDDTKAILDAINKLSHAEVVANQKTRIWNERYFVVVALAMLLMLPLYRRFPRAALQRDLQ